MANVKIKSQGNAAARIFPCLRRAAVETIESLSELNARDFGRDTLTGLSGLIADSSSNSLLYSNEYPSEGIFGSLLWNPNENLISSFLPSNANAGNSNNKTFLSRLKNSKSSKNMNRRVLSDRMDSSRNGADIHEDVLDGNGLIAGLKPLKDRYLASTLARMTSPVLQMFPEMEGYTSAVPSKRDMQALIKVFYLIFCWMIQMIIYITHYSSGASIRTRVLYSRR
jgi:hypothetical protein